MTLLSKKNVFGYGAIIAFCISWEITDLVALAIFILLVFNLAWALFNIIDYMIQSRKIRSDNESGKIIFGEDYEHTPTVSLFTLSNIVPLYVFIKEHLIRLLGFTFFFFVLQIPFEQPFQNFALSLFGKQKKATITSSDQDDGQVAEFKIHGAVYKSYNPENEFDDNYKTVIVQYLPINPKVNRFRRDYTLRPYNWKAITVSLFLSFMISFMFLTDYGKE